MTDDRPICELFMAMVDWIKSAGVENASLGPQPWRGELKTPKGYTLKVALNCSPNPIEDGPITLQPYTASITSDEVIAVALVNPYGGTWGGMPEGYLIETFKAASQPAAA